MLEVSGTLCGLALGIALLFDAVTDPLTGSLSDNWKSKWGRRHPFMYASAIPLGFCFYFLFVPPELSEIGLFIWLTAFAVLTRAAMTLYHVPHIALGAELTSNFEERTVVVSFRQGFSTIGNLASVALGISRVLCVDRGVCKRPTESGSLPTICIHSCNPDGDHHLDFGHRDAPPDSLIAARSCSPGKIQPRTRHA